MKRTTKAAELKPSKKYINNNASGHTDEAAEFHNERQHQKLSAVQLELRTAISLKKADIAVMKTATEVDFRGIYKAQVAMNLMDRELAFHNGIEKELF